MRFFVLVVVLESVVLWLCLSRLVYAGEVCLLLVVYLFEKPSLQALRAETMVERFAARMRVPGEFYVLLDCSGFRRSFAISARQFVLWYVLVVVVGARCLGKFVLQRICVD